MTISELIEQLEGLRRDRGDVLVSFVGKWAASEVEPWTEWVGWEAVVEQKAIKRVVKKVVGKKKK